MGSRKIFLSSLWLSISLSLEAQKPVEIQDSFDQYIFTYHELEFLEDATDKLTIEQVSSIYGTQFKKNIVQHPHNSNKKSAYWFRLKIKHNIHSKKTWLIEFFDQTIDHLEFYSPLPSGGFEPTLLGDDFEFDKRKIGHKNFIVDLPMQGDQEYTYYIKVKSQQRADMIIVLRSQGWLFQYALEEYFFFGIFYGMILVFSFYNLLMFIAVHERHYLYYIMYLVCVGLYEMSADGIGFEYLWPHYPSFNYYAPGIFLYLATSAALVFSGSVLDLRKKHDKVFKFFIGVFLFRSLFFLLSITVATAWFGFRFIELIPFMAIYFVSIYFLIIKKYTPARFLVGAYSVLAFGVIYKVCQYFNIAWMPLGELSHYTLGFSFIVEMLLLSFAISDKIRHIKLEKEEAQARTIEQLSENQKLKDTRDRALRKIISQQRANISLKDKVNRELEDKVKERTSEIDLKNAQLEEINQKLIKQSNEINQINSILDLDNWKLKNKVKEVLEERMHEKEMDYQEFLTLYPDDLACYRFLETLKGQEDFHCPKCNNSRCSSGAQKFSRRCTRCGYNESITANTLFHRIKFPITKAFYLAYVTTSGRANSTLEILSERLDLRLSTTWAFRQKIKGRLSRFKGVESWEQIILDDKSSVKKSKQLHLN